MSSSPPSWRLRGLFLAAAFAGCSFDLDRTQDLQDGEIRFTPRRADGALAEGALVDVSGGARVTQIRNEHKGDDDAFILPGLVAGPWRIRITEDDDGDGVADRGVWIGTALKLAPVPKNLSDGCTGTPRPVLTSQLLGDVTLEDTGSIAVTVDVPAGTDLTDARVVVWRDVGDDGDATQQPFATSLEAAAPLAADGTATLVGIIPGPVHVAVFFFAAADGPSKPTSYGTVDVEVPTGASVDATLSTFDTARVNGTEPRLTPVQIEAVWNLPDPDTVDIPQVFAGAPHSGTDLIPPDDGGFVLEEDSRAIVVDLPIGLVDVQLASSAEGAVDGLFRTAVIVPGGAVLGPVELPLLADPCLFDDDNDPATDLVRDCDRDGQLEGTDLDDDADGQPDADEPDNCKGPGLGTDRDGDGLCEPAEDPSF